MFKLKGVGGNMFKTNMYKDEKGSMMVEAAIVFPLILLVLLALITLSIIIHDIFVSQLIITTFDKSSHSYKIETEIEKRVIALNVIKKIEVNEYEDLEKKESRIKSEIDYAVPLLGERKSISIKVSNEKEYLQKIMLIEMTGDIFDDLTLAQTSKDQYEKMLKLVISGLENK